MELMKLKLSDLASEPTLRADYLYQKEHSSKINKYYSFNYLFDLIKDIKIPIPDEEFFYAEIGDVSSFGEVDPEQLNFIERSEELESLYKKIEKGDIIKPEIGDILLSKIRPYLKKNILIQENNSFYFTKAFIQIRSKKINSKIIYYLFQSKYFDKLNSISRCGKGYPTLNANDFSCLKFKKSDIDTIMQKEQHLLSLIKPIENNIDELKKIRLPDIKIINDVIGKELGIDWEKYDSLKKIQIYAANLSQLSNNIDCRMSFNFHNKAHYYILELLEKQCSKRLKNYLNIPITLGASISPEDYDDEGDCYYISMATVKSFSFNPENAQTVSKEWEKENEVKKVRQNDIIMTRSGAAIGKFAILDEDINGIFADFTMRIELKDYNPLMAYYYFRSIFVQTLIHSQKKGLQNKNIFPNQVQEFPMPDWSLAKQNKIANIIKTKIDEQKAIDLQIQDKQKQILKLINNELK